MSLRDDIKRVQRLVGVTADGIVGPVTVREVLRSLEGKSSGVKVVDLGDMDKRTLKNVRTLIPKAQRAFEKFYNLAQATAASMGCEYVAISGNRTWEAQQALYDQGRSKPGKRVTNARPGSSWHNFGVALDFGVFRGGKYLDNADPELARRVHVACSKHAVACGLEWGGGWKSFKDIPHYQLRVNASLAGARALYKAGKWA